MLNIGVKYFDPVKKSLHVRYIKMPVNNGEPFQISAQRQRISRAKYTTTDSTIANLFLHFFCRQNEVIFAFILKESERYVTDGIILRVSLFQLSLIIVLGCRHIHLAFPAICVRIESVEFDMFSHPGFVFAMYMPSGAP